MLVKELEKFARIYRLEAKERKDFIKKSMAAAAAAGPYVWPALGGGVVGYFLGSFTRPWAEAINRKYEAAVFEESLNRFLPYGVGALAGGGLGAIIGSRRNALVPGLITGVGGGLLAGLFLDILSRQKIEQK